MLNVTETAVYVEAMDLVTVNHDEVLWIGRKRFQEQTGLGREGFASGIAGCKKKKLFGLSPHGVLEMFDPKTGKPSERWKTALGYQLAKYELKEGDFDLANVTPELRAELVAEHTGISINGERISRQDWYKKLPCPFCKSITFSISFIHDGYKCHSCGSQTAPHKRTRTRKVAEREEGPGTSLPACCAGERHSDGGRDTAVSRESTARGVLGHRLTKEREKPA